MKATRRLAPRSVVISLGTAALLVALGLGWRGIQMRDAVAAFVPPPADTSSLPPALTSRAAEAGASARGFLQPIEGLKTLSRLYHANGFYEEALRCYEGLGQLEPSEARWPHLHATILSESGRLDEALPLRRRAIELAPTHVPAQLRLGDALLKLNQLHEAAAAYAQVLQYAPDNPYALLGLARCALTAGDWDSARAQLQHALRRHPDFYGALSLAVTVAGHFGDEAQARTFRAAIATREFSDLPDTWVDSLALDCYDPYRLSVAAAVAREAGNPVVARQHLERAIELAPDHASYRRQLAKLLTAANDHTGARRQLERAVALAPEDADSWLLLVSNRIATGDSSDAARVLARALEACPRSPSLHLERARYLSAVGRTEEAVSAYRESYRLRPSEASPLVELASLYFSASRVDEASAVLHEALRKQPEHPIAMTTLGLIAIAKGDEAGARAWWLRVRAQPGAPPEAAAAIRQAFRAQFGRSLN